MKIKLTPAQLAALAAGATMEQVTASDDVSDPTATAGVLEEQVLALAGEVATLKTANEEQANKLTALETELAAANASLETATATATSATEASAAMSGVILGRVKNMSIALNVTAPETCEDPVALVALHAELDEKFKAKFAAGRVSAVSNKPESKAKPSWTQGLMAAASKIQVY